MFLKYLSPRRAAGRFYAHPQVFREYLKNGGPPFLVYLFIYLFGTFYENFKPMSPKVRSPGHVK